MLSHGDHLLSTSNKIHFMEKKNDVLQMLQTLTSGLKIELNYL